MGNHRRRFYRCGGFRRPVRPDSSRKWIPPLRERPGDILTLFARFALACAQRGGESSPVAVSPAFAEKLRVYPWPGNVRELENAAEKFVVLRRLLDDDAAASEVADSFGSGVGVQGESFKGTLEEIERRAARAVFNEESGNISRTAKRLGVDRQTLRRKLEGD